MADLGTDLSCLEDLSPTMAEVSGRTCLAQAVARRLLTPRGRLIYDPNYGYDLEQFLNDDLGPGDLAKIAANIQNEALKDERVLTATAAVVVQNKALIVTLTIDDGDGPFTFVLPVSLVTVQLLQVAQ